MSYDIFLTNAIGDGVKVRFFIFVISSLFHVINRNYKLWDLRSAQYVNK